MPVAVVASFASKTLMIIGIVAIAEDLAIGRGGKLPWHYSSDLKFFKEMTTGNTIVMGAKTWRSIGRPLQGRLNVVLSRRGDIDLPPEVRLLRDKDQVMALSQGLDTNTFIIGGAEIFRSFADKIDRWIVTEVPLTVQDADTFMPANFLDDFELESTRDLGEGLIAKFYARRSQN